MPTVGFHTLGCKLNFTETSTLSRQFAGNGFQVVDFQGLADVYVINTCSVTENADRKCRKIIQQARKRNPSAFILVVGCYAQLKPQEIADIPGVDAVLGAAEKFRLFELIHDFTKRPAAEVHRCQINDTQAFVPTQSEEERTRAFVKVQDGCNYKCSFCTIPLARGTSRSDEPEHVLQRCQQLAEKGFQELVITGINLGDYGQGLKQPGQKLIHLLARLDEALSQVPRIRLSSIEPNLLDDELIAFVAASRRIMPHFHMPLQSGSNFILKRMRRRYQRELYEDRVRQIHARIPHASIGCDVIVGFPGEGRPEFEETHTLLQQSGVTYLHVFPFSARTHTPAEGYEAQVPKQEKDARCQILRNLSSKKQHLFAQQARGQVRPVLFERKQQDGWLFGHTDNYIRVAVPTHPGLPGNVLPIRLGNQIHDGCPVGIIEEGKAAKPEPMLETRTRYEV